MSCGECGEPADEVVCLNCLFFGDGADVVAASQKRATNNLNTLAQLRQELPEELSTSALLQSTGDFPTVLASNVEPDWGTIPAQQVGQTVTLFWETRTRSSKLMATRRAC